MKAPAKMNFLIVDDVDNMRRSIRAMLKLINYGKVFYEAANGKEAWKILDEEECRVDFIISDYKMPHMSGTELLNLIRANKKYRDIPFLMITAETNMEVVAEAAEHDVDAYMTKPFVTASLEQKIQELLAKTQNPDALTIHLRKVRDLKEKGDIDGAIAEANKALEINKMTSRPYRELGQLYLKKADMKNALLNFKKATDLNTLDVVSYDFMGQIFYRLGEIPRAVESFSRAVEISPRHADRALKFANLLLKQKKTKEAEKVFRLIIRNNPDALDLKEDIAHTCLEQGLYDLAVKTYKDVIKHDPERVYLNKKLGIAMFHRGDTGDATSLLETTIEKMGEDIEVMLTLAKAYCDTKMWIRADKWATKVIRLDPENKAAKEIQDKCL